MLTFLVDRGLRPLFLGGKSGVGKTLGAAAAALPRARRFPQDHFLLVSPDPAHLADSLADFRPPHNLSVLEFSAQDCQAAFKTKRHNGPAAGIRPDAIPVSSQGEGECRF